MKINLKAVACSLLLFSITACNDTGGKLVASFESADMANKVLVLLNQSKITAEIVTSKDEYSIVVIRTKELEARQILSKYNFYYKNEDLNDLLESKFASLSKLESIKSNLLEGREIYNQLNIIPGVLRSNVIVSGSDQKRISVLIISFNDLSSASKVSIERFLKGVAAERDTLTLEYLVQSASDEKV